MESASFRRRMMASTIDIILILISGIVGIFLATGVISARSQNPPIGVHYTQADISQAVVGATLGILMAISIAFNSIYFLLEASPWQASPGKKLLGLRVTNSDGHRLSFGQSWGRRLIINLWSFGTLGAGFWLPFLRADRLALHDLISRTRVVRSATRADRQVIEPTIGDPHNLASLGVRFFAWQGDLWLLLLGPLICGLALLATHRALAIPTQPDALVLGLMQDALWLIPALYVTIMPLLAAWRDSTTAAATPGKWGLQLRICRSNGQPIGWMRALVRNIIKYWFTPITIFFPIFNERRQMLHDLVADTIVIRQERPFPDDPFPAINRQAAPIGSRLGSLVIDGLIFGVPLFVASVLLTRWLGGRMVLGGWLIEGTLTVIGAFILALFEASPLQATPGKWLMNCQVISLDGQRLNFGWALMRNLGKLFTSQAGMTGYALAKFSRRRRAAHDYLGDSVVVTRRNAERPTS